MVKDFIPELQPLFCSRASLLQAQDKLTNNPDMDCQMRLRFADGSEVALKNKRTHIKNTITKHNDTNKTSKQSTQHEIVTEETNQND